MKPLVSILIPAYNSGKWIADTLRSALVQTWDNKEIIVVDDGSKDDTLAIARQFEGPKVKVVRQENRGAAAARNAAFALCQGDYIQWFDADDLLSPDKIERQVKALGSVTVRTLLSCGWAYFLYRPSRASFVPTPLWQDLTPADWLERKLSQNLHMQTATWLASRQLSEAAGPWDPTMYADDDGEYFCRVLLASDGVRFVPDAKVYYRAVGAGSLSYLGNSDRKLEAQWRSMQLHIAAMQALESGERARAACVRYLQNWLFFFDPERPDLVAEMQKKANELGGQLETPKFSWKYRWIEQLLGRKAAKTARLTLPNLKWSLARSWDKTLLRFTKSSV